MSYNGGYVMVMQGREVGEADIGLIRDWLAAHPEWNRCPAIFVCTGRHKAAGDGMPTLTARTPGIAARGYNYVPSGLIR